MPRQKREVNAADKLLHYRISVPKDDQTVAQWMEKQYNISISIRQLVRAFVREHGLVDITCIDVGESVFAAETSKTERKELAEAVSVPAASPSSEPAVRPKATKEIGDANDALSNMLKNGLVV